MIKIILLALLALSSFGCGTAPTDTTPVTSNESIFAPTPIPVPAAPIAGPTLTATPAPAPAPSMSGEPTPTPTVSPTPNPLAANSTNVLVFPYWEGEVTCQAICKFNPATETLAIPVSFFGNDGGTNPDELSYYEIGAAGISMVQGQEVLSVTVSEPGQVKTFSAEGCTWTEKDGQLLTAGFNDLGVVFTCSSYDGVMQ